MSSENKSGWSKLARAGALATGAATLVGAFATIPQLPEAVAWLRDQFGGFVELPGSYPNERWMPASMEQFEWLLDEWCFPSLPGFRSRFRAENGALTRQNEASGPRRFVSEWVEAEVYISNRNMLRLRYKASDWPGTYIEFDTAKTTEWRENERYSDDQGVVTSGDKRLVLSCAQCSVSKDGLTYVCGDAV